MSDYGFIHAGKVFTPDCTPDITPEDNDARNRDIEARELAVWADKPDRMLTYYRFPAEHLPSKFPRSYRASFVPLLHTYVNLTAEDKAAGRDGLDHKAIVTTWRGVLIGRIIEARVYTHNFGSRMVSLTVKGTNGALYHGRASWDHGECIWLRKSKARR